MTIFNFKFFKYIYNTFTIGNYPTPPKQKPDLVTGANMIRFLEKAKTREVIMLCSQVAGELGEFVERAQGIVIPTPLVATILEKIEAELRKEMKENL
jgi:hypothetical protein